MAAYYLVKVVITDTTTSTAASKMTVTLTFGGPTLTEITNSSGMVVFRAYSGMNFVAGSLVSVSAVDPAHVLQPTSTTAPYYLPAGESTVISLSTKLEFEIVLTVKDGSTALPGIVVNI